MKSRMEASLAVTQLGMTLVGAVAAAMGGVSVDQHLAPRLREGLHLAPGMAEAVAIAVFVLPLAGVTIMVGELIPKAFGLKNPEHVCLRLAPAMAVVAAVTFPVVWCFENLTKKAVALAARLVPPAQVDHQASLAELRSQVSVLRAGKVIGMQQERIIVGAARLSQMKVREVMLPRDDVVMLHVEAALTESLIVAHLDLHTRFPVTEKPGDADGIVGYVNFKEMVFLAKTHPEHPHLREITRPIIKLDADLALNEALRRMVGEHVHLALVTDRAGRVIGMVTQEDIFEELVGDIQDEFDRLPRHLSASGRQWVVGGGATLGRLREVLGKPDLAALLPNETAVNDWICSGLSRRPRGGDALSLDGVSVLVRKVRRHHVTEALIDASGRPLAAGPDTMPSV
jgi:putative hemolysin